MDQQPPKPPFSRQPPPFNRKRTGQTGRLPQLGGQPQGPAAPQRSQLDNSDSVQVTGQVGPVRKDPPPVIPRKPEGELFSSTAATITTLEDGAKIVRYAQPQKLANLLSDAKSNIGGESSRFYGKGWVIGQQIAKIAPDGMSVIYYPQDISELVRDLLGPDSETL
ncbi:MAG: hypothetical protein CVV27_16225 [Candidatus Melainabacteria bacterium HGW-Melainabacteria-1]|nr:MAG: hypothetical protein CVV27_16225 [Candidatus Melainabacteria bacterium HGW-Melainabacteria-1]